MTDPNKEKQEEEDEALIRELEERPAVELDLGEDPPVEELEID